METLNTEYLETETDALPTLDEVTAAAAEDHIEQAYGPYFYADGEKVKPNHIAIVARFADEHRTIFLNEINSFLRYSPTTGVWEPIDNGTLKRELGEVYRRIAASKKSGEVAFRATNGLLNSFVNILKGWQSPYGPEKRNPKLFPVADGVLDFSTVPPTLKPHDPEYFFQHGSRFKYDPSATCPQFLKFMREALPEEDISLIQRYFGSTFLGYNTNQKILILKGTPGGGKSTLVTILERIVGLDNVAYLRTQHLGGRFEFSGFLGKKLLTGKDVPADTLSLKGAQFLKSLVGGDRLQAEIKYSGKAEIWGRFHVIVACNNSLRIALDKDMDAWRRRLIVVNYERTKTTTPIAELAEKLIEAEGAGIFAWMVQGAIDHAKEVEESHGYVLTDTQIERVESLLGQSQSCREFIDRGVEADKESDIAVQELQKGYVDFCRERGWTPEPQAEAEKRIPELMLEIHEQLKRHDIMRGEKAVRGYKHIRLKS